MKVYQSFAAEIKQGFREYSTQWIAQNNLIKEHHVMPTDDDPPSQQNLQLQRRRAWDKGPVTLARLTTCNRVKTTNPEYKNTQQDLTGWNFTAPTLKGMQAFKEIQVVNCRFLSNSTKEGGVFVPKAKQLQLTSI